MDFRLTPIIDGDESGETLMFIQGWPDDASLWDPQVAALAERYRCVRITLPNFGGARDTRWGHSTDEIIHALARCIREVSPDAPVTLIIHDWGAMWGHLLHQRHPELVQRVAGLDIAPHVRPGVRCDPRHPRLPVVVGGRVLRRRFGRRLDDPPYGIGHACTRAVLAASPRG